MDKLESVHKEPPMHAEFRRLAAQLNSRCSEVTLHPGGSFHATAYGLLDGVDSKVTYDSATGVVQLTAR